jgi:hypothetical protein
MKNKDMIKLNDPKIAEEWGTGWDRGENATNKLFLSGGGLIKYKKRNKSKRKNSKLRKSKRRNSKKRISKKRKSKRLKSKNKRLRGGVLGERCTTEHRNMFGFIKNSCASSTEYCGGSSRNGNDWICRLRSCGIPGYQTQRPTDYGLAQPHTDTRGRSPSPARPARLAGHPHPYHPNTMYAPGVGSDVEEDDPDGEEAQF